MKLPKLIFLSTLGCLAFNFSFSPLVNAGEISWVYGRNGALSKLIGFALTLGISNNSLLAQPSAQFKTFAEWCENQNQLGEETKRTIEVLLQVAETTDRKYSLYLINQSVILEIKKCDRLHSLKHL